MTDDISNKTSSTEFTTDLDEDFSSLQLSDISPAKKLEKKPKRILYFSDGTLEEYSSDEEEKHVADISDSTDPKSLNWGPWMTYMASRTGKSVLSKCDYVGEGIANFLGITSQKYFYEIEEYKRAMKEEQREKDEEAAQMAGWTAGPVPSEIEIGPEFNQEKFMEKEFEFKEISLSAKEEDPNVRF